jgi:hypothetical protein
MLERGTAAKYATAVFHRQQNDFDVYIEDTAPGYDKIFSTLLSRAISSRISLTRVFPLGGRDKVIEAAKRDISSGNKGRGSVFIVDGDLYLLCGEKENLPENVVVLSRYCIENFLLDEDAFVSIVDEEETESDEEALRLKMDFSGWVKRSRASLEELFRIFATAQKLQSGIPTLSRGSKSICGTHDGELDAQKANAIYKEIYDSLSKEYGVVVVEAILNSIQNNVDATKCFVSTYVSGKDFVLPFALQKIRSITKTKSQNISIKLRLSKKCNVSPLQAVVRSIADVIKCSDIVPTA